MTIKILLIDDQFGSDANLQDGLAEMVESLGVEFVYSAGQKTVDGDRVNDIQTAIKAVEKNESQISMVMVDRQFDSGPLNEIGRPSGRKGDSFFGYEIEQALAEAFPDLPVVRFTMHQEKDYSDYKIPFLSKPNFGDDEEADFRFREDLRMALVRHGRLSLEMKRRLLNIPEETLICSSLMIALYAEAYDLSKSDDFVLLRGESGTGKEHLARYIHANSNRKSFDLISINMGAITPTLFEAEFFGTVFGAASDAIDRPGCIEKSGKGSLFLDEIGAMPLEKQPLLLRILMDGLFSRVGETNTRKSECRFIAATQDPIEELSRKGLFRSDLLARFQHAIYLPPLRDRPDDIPGLIKFFFDQEIKRQCKTGITIHDDVFDYFQNHPLYNNTRDIEYPVKRAIRKVPNRGLLRVDHFGFSPRHASQKPTVDKVYPRVPNVEENDFENSTPVIDLEEILMAMKLIKLDPNSKQLIGYLPKLENALSLFQKKIAVAALLRTQKAGTGKYVPTQAMTLLSKDPNSSDPATLSTTEANRTLNRLLGRKGNEKIDAKILEEIVLGIQALIISGGGGGQ